MRVINKVTVELTTEEHRTLLDAQRLWQVISDEVRMRIYEEVGYYYKVGDNE